MLLTNKHIKIIIIILLFIWQHCLDTFLQYMHGNTVWNHIYQVTGLETYLQYSMYCTWKHYLEAYISGNIFQNHIYLSALYVTSLAIRFGTFLATLSRTIYWQHGLEPYVPGNSVWNHIYLATLWKYIYLAILSGTIFTWQHCLKIYCIFSTWKHYLEPYLTGNSVRNHIYLATLSETRLITLSRTFLATLFRTFSNTVWYHTVFTCEHCL